MAGFRVRGLDRLDIELSQLAALDDADVLLILERGGEVYKAAQQRYLNSFHRITGQLEASISITQKTAGERPSVRIEPKGKRRGAFTGKRMKKENGRRRSSGHYEGSNAEVAWYLEYGTPRMPAAHWMETANEEAAEEAQAAMEAAWDEHLKTLGL